MSGLSLLVYRVIKSLHTNTCQLWPAFDQNRPFNTPCCAPAAPPPLYDDQHTASSSAGESFYISQTLRLGFVKNVFSPFYYHLSHVIHFSYLISSCFCKVLLLGLPILHTAALSSGCFFFSQQLWSPLKRMAEWVKSRETNGCNGDQLFRLNCVCRQQSFILHRVCLLRAAVCFEFQLHLYSTNV